MRRRAYSDHCWEVGDVIRHRGSGVHREVVHIGPGNGAWIMTKDGRKKRIQDPGSWERIASRKRADARGGGGLAGALVAAPMGVREYVGPDGTRRREMTHAEMRAMAEKEAMRAQRDRRLERDQRNLDKKRLFMERYGTKREDFAKYHEFDLAFSKDMSIDEYLVAFDPAGAAPAGPLRTLDRQIDEVRALAS